MSIVDIVDIIRKLMKNRNRRVDRTSNYEQLSFMPNGSISPCPYREDCINHPAGCKGLCYWCGRRIDRKDKMLFEKRRMQRLKQEGKENE